MVTFVVTDFMRDHESIFPSRSNPPGFYELKFWDMEVKSIKPRFNKRGNKLKPNDKAKICIEVYWSQNQRVFIDTEFSVIEGHWDKKTRSVNYKNDNHKFINAKLRERVSKIESYEYSLKNNGQGLTPELLDDFITRKFENHKGQSFNDFFEYQINHREFKTKSTQQHHKKTFNKFQAFRKHVAFHDLSVALIEKFDAFMEAQGLGVNARANHHKNLKANLSLAATEGYIEHRKIPYATQLGGSAGKYSVKTEQGSIVYLDFEEKERLEELSYPENQTYERYRKVFLFMCYTGLRISDIENFRPSHLHHNSKGYEIDLHKMIKTRKPVFLQLYNLFEGKPELILKEFLQESFGTDDFDEIKDMNVDSRVFPYITGQVVNRELKTIANDAKIYKNLSNHVGRHTFGTQMAFLTKGNVNLVRDLMGHGKAETTMIYIRLADKMRGQLLQQVDWNAHKEISETHIAEKTEAKPAKIEKPKTEAKPKVKKTDNQYLQIQKYITEKVFPALNLPSKGKLKISLNEENLRSYASLLPFKPNDYLEYQKNPIDLQAFIQDASFLKEIDTIQNAFNNHPWVKGACIKLSIMFMPIMDESNMFMI